MASAAIACFFLLTIASAQPSVARGTGELALNRNHRERILDKFPEDVGADDREDTSPYAGFEELGIIKLLADGKKFIVQHSRPSLEERRKFDLMVEMKKAEEEARSRPKVTQSHSFLSLVLIVLVAVVVVMCLYLCASCGAHFSDFR